MKKLILLCLVIITFVCNCIDMGNMPFERESSSTRSSTPPPAIEYATYIQQRHDSTEEIQNKRILRLQMCRWAFQPISIVFQITAGSFFIGSLCYIDKYPETAKILNGVGLGVTVASFVINTLLLKIDNKLEEMDNYILQRREEQRREAQIYPAIIQR